MPYISILMSGYTHQNGTDPRATGCVTYTEICRTRNGKLRLRSTDSNGRYSSSGKSHEVSNAGAMEIINRAILRTAKNGGLDKSQADKICKRLRINQ